MIDPQGNVISTGVVKEIRSNSYPLQKSKGEFNQKSPENSNKERSVGSTGAQLSTEASLLTWDS